MEGRAPASPFPITASLELRPPQTAAAGARNTSALPDPLMPRSHLASKSYSLFGEAKFFSQLKAEEQ